MNSYWETLPFLASHQVGDRHDLKPNRKHEFEKGVWMEIKTDNFQVWYDSETVTVFFSGSLRLTGTAEYSPISELLEKVLAQNPQQLKLDLQHLQFLNSSGINMLCKFVINVRKKNTVAMQVIGSKDIPWQGKSLKNLQKMMPKLQLILE